MDEQRLQKAIEVLKRRVEETSVEQVAHETSVGRSSIQRLMQGHGLYRPAKLKILAWFDSLTHEPAHHLEPDEGLRAILDHIQESPWRDERRRRLERYIRRLTEEGEEAIQQGQVRPINRKKRQ